MILPGHNFVDLLLYDDLVDHQLAGFENALKELLWRASTRSTDMPPEDMSTDKLCTTLLTNPPNLVTPICNTETSPTLFPNLDELYVPV